MEEALDAILVHLTRSEDDEASQLVRCDICKRTVLRRNYKRHALSTGHLKHMIRIFDCTREQAIRAISEELRGHPAPFIPPCPDEFGNWAPERDVDFDLLYPPPQPQPPALPVPTHFRDELIEIGLQLGWECAVCFEPMDKHRFHLTPCFHKVCKVCIMRLENEVCPVCRQ